MTSSKAFGACEVRFENRQRSRDTSPIRPEASIRFARALTEISAAGGYQSA